MPDNNTLLTATDLGTLSASLTINDSIDDTDPIDFYRFTLAQNSDLNIVFRSDLTLRVTLIADLNGNGVVDRGETVTSDSASSGNDVSLFPALPAGSYVVEVEQRSNSDYELTLIETSRPASVPSDPGSTLGTAFDLGTISAPRPLNEYVGDLDDLDVYKFTLAQSSDVSFTLDTSTRGSLSASLIADLNGNGIADSGETLTSARISSIGDGYSAPLPAGTYFTSIVPFEFLTGGLVTSQYESTLVATPNPSNVATDPGNTISTAFNLGTLSGIRTINEYVGDQIDVFDFYQFTIAQTSNVLFNVVGTSPGSRGVTASLIADLNNNGIVDSGEIIDSGDFSETLEPGTYFVRISDFGPTHYEMTFTQTRDLSGDDRLVGTDDNDRINAGDGDDTVRGRGGDDRIVGGDGNDSLFGDDGDDVLRGGDGDDRLVGGEGNDVLLGQDGDDRMIGQNGNDTLRGGDGDDIMRGGDGNDTLVGQDGGDRLVGGNGNDTLRGGRGDDQLRGNNGNDTLLGQANDDRLLGGAGSDRLNGSAGNDFLNGQGDNDRLSGGAGNDTLDGNDGNDVIITGDGSDRIRLRRGDGFDRVKDFQDDQDKIDLVGIGFRQLTIRQRRDDVLIRIGRNNAMLLEDTRLGTIDRDDFV